MRKRFSEYYLDEINSDVALYANGTVGELESGDVEIEETLQSRVEGREHRVKRTVQGLVQVTLHGSLADYVASRRLSRESSEGVNRYNYHPVDDVWTIEDIPSDVIARYEAWRDNLDGPNIEDIRSSAKALIATEEQREEVSPCKSCALTSPKFRHACRGCAGEFYDYPLVRIGHSSRTDDVPFDLADIVARDPRALTLDTDYSIRDRELHAERVLRFHPDRIPAEYIYLTGVDAVSIDKSDKLHRGVEVVLDYWCEDADRADTMRDSYKEYFLRGFDLKQPGDYIQLMQEYASHSLVREASGGEKYEQKYQKLLEKVGRVGLALNFRYRYAGMGETDAVLDVVDPRRHFVSRSMFALGVDARSTIENVNPGDV